MKSNVPNPDYPLKGRPRKGAWIEIGWEYNSMLESNRRPRKGAWIEITTRCRMEIGGLVAPARGRGLK